MFKILGFFGEFFSPKTGCCRKPLFCLSVWRFTSHSSSFYSFSPRFEGTPGVPNPPDNMPAISVREEGESGFRVEQICLMYNQQAFLNAKPENLIVSQKLTKGPFSACNCDGHLILTKKQTPHPPFRLQSREDRRTERKEEKAGDKDHTSRAFSQLQYVIYIIMSRKDSSRSSLSKRKHNAE